MKEYVVELTEEEIYILTRSMGRCAGDRVYSINKHVKYMFDELSTINNHLPWRFPIFTGRLLFHDE